MTTLTRLAGMTDVPRPQQPDIESQPPSEQALTSRPSQRSLPSSPPQDDQPWGPRHPCFPHPNPHAPRGSPLAASTRIIRVPRDWLTAGDVYPAMANVYPEILAEWVSETQFRELVAGVNDRLRKAFDAGSLRTIMDGVLGPLTGWLWEDAGLTGAKSGVKELERYIDWWNGEREREGSAVRVVQLRRTGFMSLDIQIPDPQIDLVHGQD